MYAQHCFLASTYVFILIFSQHIKFTWLDRLIFFPADKASILNFKGTDSILLNLLKGCWEEELEVGSSPRMLALILSPFAVLAFSFNTSNLSCSLLSFVWFEQSLWITSALWLDPFNFDLLLESLGHFFLAPFNAWLETSV